MQFEENDVKVVRDEDEWNTLVDDGTIVYGTWEWGSICEHFGHDRYYLGVEREGVLEAGIPAMYVGGRLFGTELVSMPYSPYGAVLQVDEEYHKEKLSNAVATMAEKLGVSRAIVRGHDLGWEPFRSNSRFVTFEVDLSCGEEPTWNDVVSSRFRRGVRKARKEDVSVEKGFKEETFTQFYDMYLNNMQYHGTPPYSRSFFREVNHRLNERDAFELYMAYNDAGKPINGITVFFHGDRAIYWTGVSDHEYRELNGGSRLLWQAIADSCERGYETFDLGRTREDTGVYNYKKSIGVPVDLVDSHYSPHDDTSLVNPEDEKYQKYKRAWRMLPTSVTEHLGPLIRKRLSM